MRPDRPYAHRPVSATRVASGPNEGGVEMDGLARMTALTTRDRVAAQRRHDDEAFRAWHCQPAALPDGPSDVIQLQRLSVRRLARLIGRTGAA